MRTKMNNNGFTLVEMMTAVGFSVVLIGGVFAFYNTASQIYSSGVSGQILQDGANVLLSKIIEGQTEGVSVIRLATSSSFYIPSTNSGILYFCQDALCTPFDTTARWYSVDPTNTSVRYYHPTANPLGYDVIYTAPIGSTVTLRFSPVYGANPAPPPATVQLPNLIEIDVALIQTLAANVVNRTAPSGSTSTYVLLRNHP